MSETDLTNLDFNIKIIFSVDGIGKKFEYIRTPLQWDQVNDNMHKILDMKYPNITADLSYTINPLNLYYHHDIFQFFLNKIINLICEI